MFFSHISFACMHCHGTFYPFAGIWQVRSDGMESDRGCHRFCADACFDKDVSDGPISPWEHTFWQYFEFFSMQLCAKKKKVQGELSSRCFWTEQMEVGVSKRSEGELSDSASITLTLFKGLHAQLSPFLQLYDTFVMGCQDL